MEKSEDNTYVVDTESPVEMARLIDLDRLITQGMGGPLAGLPTKTLHNVLDVACGPGSWVLDVAFALPDTEVAGIDISQIMIDYANARARSQQLSNASFGIMNILNPLDFADASFDLVNARFLVAALQRHKWQPFLQECTRLLHPGGILRLTELQDYGVTTSPAYERFMALTAQGLYQQGYGFSVDGRTFDVSQVLPHFLRQAGYQQVQHAAYAIEVSAGTHAWQDFYQNALALGSLAPRLLTGAGVISASDFQQLHQQILIELQQEDFCGMWHYMSVWGTKPQVEAES